MEQNEMMEMDVKQGTGESEAVSNATDDGKKKGKKKIKPWQIFTALAAVVFLVLIIAMIQQASKITMSVPVEVAEVKTGSILQTIDTSGSVESEESKTYFAGVPAVISELSVQAGQTVKKGDVLLTYDTEALEKSLKQTELDTQITEYGADATVIGINHTEQKAAEAAASYEEAKQYVDHYTGCVEKINRQLQEAAELTQEQGQYTAEIEELTKKLEENPKDKKTKKALSKAEKNLEKVTKKLEEYNVNDLQGALEVCSGDLAEYKSRMQQYEAEKEATDPAASVTKAQQAAVKESARMAETSAQELLEEARKGIAAEFDGIVSEVTAIEGQTTAEGMQLFTIQNANNLKVKLAVSKYDMQKLAVGQKAAITINEKEYTGTVSNISRVATYNASGAVTIDADIHIDNPDDAIVLGMEAKVSIEVAEEKDIILIPNTCVNYSSEGVFCYVVVDGIVEKRVLETGISDEENMQIISGLKVGDQVITQVTDMIQEGAQVTPTPVTAEPAEGTADESTAESTGETADESTEDSTGESTDESAEE